jgi:hypothetical protein
MKVVSTFRREACGLRLEASRIEIGETRHEGGLLLSGLRLAAPRGEAPETRP